MIFRAGDRVHVAAFGKGVVRDVRNAGRYLVDVKGRAMLVDGSQLEPLQSSARRGQPPSAATTALDPEERSVGRPRSLDLHGLTVEEALAALDAFLNEALLDGEPEVRVIHGRSGGRIRAAVHRHLRELSVVRQFRLDPHNEGVTIVGF